MKNPQSVWTLAMNAEIPIAVHSGSLLVSVHTLYRKLTMVWVQDYGALRDYHVTQSQYSGVLGFRHGLVRRGESDTHSEFEVGESLPFQPGDVRWMLASMRRAESVRGKEPLPLWAEDLWKTAKVSVRRAFVYNLAGEQVWWGAKIRLKFRRTEAGMEALGKLDSVIQSGHGGFRIARSGQIDMEGTLASGGEWLDALRLSQRNEYTVAVTDDFSPQTAEWFEKEIQPSLAEFEVVE